MFGSVALGCAGFSSSLVNIVYIRVVNYLDTDIVAPGVTKNQTDVSNISWQVTLIKINFYF